MISCTDRQKNVSDYYLGQIPPGAIPEIFAPGIISNGFHELGIAISPQDGEVFYIMSDKSYSHYVIINARMENGKWTKPEVAPFSSDYTNYALNFSSDGNRLYFSSKRPLPGTIEPKDDFDIWFVENKNGEWSEAQHLKELSTEFNEVNMSFAANDRMYLHISKPGLGGDIYTSDFVGGKYQPPVSIGKPINTEHNEARPCIAPDESFLLFHSNRPGTLGQMDIYVSFRNENGEWGEPIGIGEPINSEWSDFGPSLSPNGKYLFYSSYRSYEAEDFKGRTYDELLEMYRSPQNGYATLYWVDAKVIEELRPENIQSANDLLPKTISEAIESGNLLEVKKQLEANPEMVLYIDSDKNSPLHLAVKFNRIDIAEFLLAKKAVLELKNKFGRTPLLVGVVRGADFRLCKMLIEKGAQINTIDIGKNTPLLQANQRGRYDLVKFFLDKGVEIPKDSIDRQMLFNYASLNGHMILIDTLLNSGVNINTNNLSDGTMLHNSAQGRHVELINFFLLKGLDVDRRIDTDLLLYTTH